ncbi:MAG: MFS transporter [Vulcanimicrobiaceae bacterium]
MFAKRPCEENGSPRAARTPPAAAGSAVLLAAIVGSGMAFIDGTAVNVALPVLERDLSATSAQVQWVVEGYSLFLSALLLAGGSLGDRLGRRLVFATGVALFALASLACGFATGIAPLVAARCVQGIGAALATPGSLALISANFGEAERGRAIGTWSGFSSITAALGPLLGGFFAQHVSWRAVFFINVPLAAVALAALLRVPESRDPEAGRIDVPGAALATAALGALVYGLIRLQSSAADAAGACAVGAGLVLLGVFIAVERRAKAPMVPLELFADRTFSVTNAYTLLLYAALGGGLFFIPFDLIFVQRYSPAAAGAAMLPFIVIMFLLSRFSGGLVVRIGARLPLVAGGLVAGIGFASYALCGVGRPYWVSFFPAAVLLGLGGAGFVAPLTTAVMGSVDAARAGTASGINNAVSRTAGLLAIALLGIVLAMSFDRQLPQALQAAHASPAAVASAQREHAKMQSAEVPADVRGPADRQALRSAIDTAYSAGFDVVMLVSAALCWAAALLAFVALPGDSRGAAAVPRAVEG